MSGFAALLTVLVATTAAGAAAPQQLAEVGYALTGEQPGDWAGHQVATGDFDGDGIGDLAVGAWQNDSGGEQSGAVYIEYGPIRRGFSLARADAKLYPQGAGEYAGEGPIGVLDIDGDRRDDLVLGVPGSFLVSQPASPGKIGEAFLLYGGKRLKGPLVLDKVADAVFTGLQIEEWLGFGSAGVGDLDGDGFEDLAMGAPATAAYTGVVYLFYGRKQRFAGSVPVTDADATILGTRPGEMFGYHATGGDLDADRAADLLLTAMPYPADQPAGVSLFYGGKGERLSGVLSSALAYA